MAVKDVREKVVKAIEGGMSRRQAAARLDLGPATAVRGAKRVETTGDVALVKMGGDRRPQRIEAHQQFILKEIKTKPDTTIMEPRDKLRERHGLSLGYGTVWRSLSRHGITRKKRTGHASEQEPRTSKLRAKPAMPDECRNYFAACGWDAL